MTTARLFYILQTIPSNVQRSRKTKIGERVTVINGFDAIHLCDDVDAMWDMAQASEAMSRKPWTEMKGETVYSVLQN